MGRAAGAGKGCGLVAGSAGPGVAFVKLRNRNLAHTLRPALLVGLTVPPDAESVRRPCQARDGNESSAVQPAAEAPGGRPRTAAAAPAAAPAAPAGAAAAPAPGAPAALTGAPVAAPAGGQSGTHAALDAEVRALEALIHGPGNPGGGRGGAAARTPRALPELAAAVVRLAAEVGGEWPPVGADGPRALLVRVRALRAVVG
jgi:hypothetical protein